MFIAPAPEFFANQGITALIVTKDGQVVTDAEMLRQVFLLYTSAYYLYEQPPQELVPAGREELGNVLNNPVFQALSVGELLRTPRAQTSETLRAMLTDRVSEKTTLEPLFDKAFATMPKGAEDALDAFSAVIENQAAHNAVLIALKPDLAAAYTNLGDTVKGSKYELQFVRLALQLLFTSHLQEERASWLESYATAFTDGAGSLDRTQLNAAVDVLAEVQSSNQQRIDIAADFMTQMSGQAILDLSGAAATKAVTQLLTQVGEKFGVRLASNAVAGTLAAVSVGASLGNLLYGSDELFANFTLAQRADELRTTFHAGRTALQDKADFEKGNAPDTLVYNGDLAAQFRAAFLLETLAAVQTQRAYADGTAATIRLPNLLEVITNLLGQDWKTAVQGLQQRADEIEIKALNEVGAPAYLETAIGLALSRMPKGPTVIVGTPVEPELPKLHPEWTSYTNGNYVNDLLVLGDTIWAATNGGVVRWDIDDNSYVKYTREYGLADNNVTSVIQSTDGTLWFGTGNGVSRLDDNNHWTTFTTDNGLVANDILDIVQSTDGTLWFNTSHGISRLDTSGHWTTFTSENRLAGKEVMSVVGNVGDSLWFNTNDGVSRLDTTNLWTTFTITDGLVSNAVRTIIQSTDGSLWFGGSSGVSQLSTDGQWSTFTSKDGLVDDGRTHITAIIQSQDGALWFGAGTGLPFDEYGEVNRLNKDGRWTTLTHEDGLANNNIQAIAEGSDGSLWFGTRGGGISRLDHSGLWTTYTTKDGLAGNSISTIFQSTDGLLWFGIGQPLRYFRGGSGVSRLDKDGRWTTLTTKDGLVNNNVNSIIQSTDGALWFGTFEIKSASEGLISVGGVSRLDIDGTWTTFTTKDGLADNAITSMIQSTDGSIWFAMVRSAGVSRLDTKGQWTTFTTNNGLVDNNVQAILQSDDGNLWFATYDKGVSRLGMDGRWTTFTTKDGLVGNSMLSIAQSADGALWFSAVNLDTHSTGVSRLDADGHWTSFMTKDALPINAVSSIVQGTDGAMWFGMYEGGVSRLGKDGRWTTFTTKDGLVNNKITSIIQSTDGALWFGTLGGVSRLDAEAVRRLATEDGASQPNEPASGGVGSTWEYQMVNGGSAIGSRGGVAALLNPLGQEGWDIAGVTGSLLIMKRAMADSTTWEYQEASEWGGDPAQVAGLLNPFGEEGWDMGGVTATFFILKRPLTNPGVWEYQSVSLASDPVSTDALLNPLGQEGWDVAGTTGPFLILKRPLVDPAAWEYQVVNGGDALMSDDPAGVANLLNPLGTEGWEMVGATATFLILKRPLANPEQWEYQKVNGGGALGGDPAGMASLLNPLGQAGWDVAGVTGPILIMKRKTE